MLFIRPAIRSAGRRFERLRCRTERKSRSIAPWIAAATGGSRVGTRERRRTTVWAKPRSRRSRTLAATSARSSLRTTAAVCGCSACRKLASAGAGLSFRRSQTERTSLRARPSTRRLISSSSSMTAARSLRAIFEPPAISGPVVRSSRNSAITASSSSWSILPRPERARAKRSMSGSASSRRKPAARSGPMAVRIIAAFSIGAGWAPLRSAGTRGFSARPGGDEGGGLGHAA